MLDVERDLMAQFATKIMGWRNFRYEDSDEGLRLIGEYKKGNEWHEAPVPDYGSEPMALWAAEAYIKNAGLVFDYIAELRKLTNCGDLDDAEEIFKVVNAQPILKVRAAVRAYDSHNSENAHSEVVN